VSARLVTVKDPGHFLPLDQPGAVVQQIRALARELSYGFTVIVPTIVGCIAQ
jgi:hypothetical protein